ncbi:MAG TPA: hypothetical protein VHL55_05570 [Acidimicrobiia bacterium]|nr:hypothetical protein [Acidimicrobiia bacterium]
MTETRWAGVLLVAGFLSFLVGAAFWKPPVYQQELPLALRKMADDERRLRWIFPWLWIGVTVTTLGLALLTSALLIPGFLVLKGGPLAPPIHAHVYPLTVGIALLV